MFYCIRHRKEGESLKPTAQTSPQKKLSRKPNTCTYTKSKAIPKESLRAQLDKSKSSNNNIAFITTYNPSHPDTFKYITSLKEGLRVSTKMQE